GVRAAVVATVLMAVLVGGAAASATRTAARDSVCVRLQRERTALPGLDNDGRVWTIRGGCVFLVRDASTAQRWCSGARAQGCVDVPDVVVRLGRRSYRFRLPLKGFGPPTVG